MSTSSTSERTAKFEYSRDQKRTYFRSLINTCDACTKCELHQGRTNVVRPRTLFTGEVNLNADLMFVGEAPGYTEDQEGLPFVGKSGKILEDAIHELGLERNVYYTNTVRCRPENNQDPLRREKEACWPYLRQEIRILRPRMIVGVGRHACNQLLGAEYLTMNELATGGPFRYVDTGYEDESKYIDIPLYPIYHPAFLLRLRDKGGEHYTTFRDNYWETFQDIKRTYKSL